MGEAALGSGELEHLLFIYGTLKSGEPNYHVMLDPDTGSAHFVGRARTTVAYPLIIGSRFNIPFLMKLPGVGHKVDGEVFAIDNAKLSALDEFEAHPTFYLREKYTVELLDDERPLVAWIYFLPTWREELFSPLKTPMFQSYSTHGDHGRPYISRYIREQMIKGQQYDFLAYVRGIAESYEDED